MASFSFLVARFFAVVFLTLIPLVGSSATIQISGGKILGATGVEINGTRYDVVFGDALCADLYDGCDDQSDLPFQTRTDAVAATQALLAQVLVEPQISTNLVNGCNTGRYCNIYTPYSLEAARTAGIITSGASFMDWGVALTDDSSHIAYTVADWSVAKVPVPASLALLFSGLSIFVMIGRRKYC